MFFIGIFGIENKNKEIKILDNLNCKKCNKVFRGKLIKNFNYFHFFFIPLFRWNIKYYIICDGCGTNFSISVDKGKAIENNEPVNITYWDLDELESSNYRENYNSGICRNCGMEVDPSFQFCPHCGNRIKF